MNCRVDVDAPDLQIYECYQFLKLENTPQSMCNTCLLSCLCYCMCNNRNRYHTRFIFNNNKKKENVSSLDSCDIEYHFMQCRCEKKTDVCIPSSNISRHAGNEIPPVFLIEITCYLKNTDVPYNSNIGHLIIEAVSHSYLIR